MARDRDDDARAAGMISADDNKIIQEAKDRFTRCESWEAEARKHFIQDIKFANADAYNMWQWPDDARNLRQVDKKPCFTINKTQQHCLHIQNDARQNKQSVVVKPVGGGASFEAAQIYEGIVRHIEYLSDAGQAYQTAVRFQVQGGIGYWRVVTDYISDDSFDQEIYIRRVKDPLSVYLDPDHVEADGSDSMFGFVFEDANQNEFERQHQSLKGRVGRSVLGNEDNLAEGNVRVAEYYRVVEHPDKLIARPGKEPVRASSLPKELVEAAEKSPGARVRPVMRREVQWFKIAGETIVERTTWPGSTIPIVKITGTETVIDGKLDRKGHTRALIDPQRNLNYWTSEAATQVALQTKIPWIAPLASIEELDEYWSTANTENHSILPYNHLDDQGNPIPAPTRQQPPVMAAAYIEGVKMALDGLMLVSGQYQAMVGAPSNEQSGVAIQQRQRQGDNATYHFIDHQSAGIRRTGKIIIEVAPKVYDTERVKKILAEDGSETEVQIDPKAPDAYRQTAKGDDDDVKAIFNPNVGRYEVEADVGPAFATRRQEAFNAFVQIATQSPEMMHVIGDLMFEVADFPLADKIAERLRRLVPAQATGDGPSPDVIALQSKVQALSQALNQALQKAEDQRRRADSKDEQHIIGAYEAETKRMEALKAVLNEDPQMLVEVVRQLLTDAAMTRVNPAEGQEQGRPGDQAA